MLNEAAPADMQLAPPGAQGGAERRRRRSASIPVAAQLSPPVRVNAHCAFVAVPAAVHVGLAQPRFEALLARPIHLDYGEFHGGRDDKHGVHHERRVRCPAPRGRRNMIVTSSMTSM